MRFRRWNIVGRWISLLFIATLLSGCRAPHNDDIVEEAENSAASNVAPEIPKVPERPVLSAEARAILDRYFTVENEAMAAAPIVDVSFAKGGERNGDFVFTIRNVSAMAVVGFDRYPVVFYSVPDCVEKLYTAIWMGDGYEPLDKDPKSRLEPGQELVVRLRRDRYREFVGREEYGCPDGTLPELRYYEHERER